MRENPQFDRVKKTEKVLRDYKRKKGEGGEHSFIV